MTDLQAPAQHAPRIRAALRETETVTPLELFFDLVFVLAITQCTALMAGRPTWEGLAQGLLVLGVLWWSWVGYSWLTSVVDPEEGIVRVAMFGAMAGVLVCSLCVPEVFDSRGTLFAAAYAVVRLGQIALFIIASRDDPALRKSVLGLFGSTAIGVSLLLAAAATDGAVQGALWAVALTLDVVGPYFFGADGWKLVPGHFAERHGLIIIIALGESIVAIGAGSEVAVGAGEVVAACFGVGIAAMLWWMYFDVVALVAERRLTNAKPGRERNEIARDSFSYLHFPMVAGIVLVALGLKKTLAHVDEPLKLVPTVALFGGVAIYLLAHVLFRWRNVHRFSSHRMLTAVVLVALVPVGHAVDAVVAAGIVLAITVGLVVYELVRFAELREKMRHQLAHD